jgi:hypothetical protein
MAYIGNIPAESFISFEKQVFTIVNSQTAYTLSHSVVNENDIRLVVNNVVQEPGSGKAYTASGTTLTLSAALVNGTDTMYCVFLGRAIQTVNPPNASVGSAQVADSLISGKTALGATPADTDELLISDAGTLKRVDFSHLKSANTPAFQGYYSSSYQTVSDNTDTKLTIDTEEFDTNSAFDTSTSRFTIPSGQAGKYFLYTKFYTYSSNDTGRQAKIYIYKNGSATSPTDNQYRLTQDSIVGGALYTSYIYDASVGDYFEAYGNFNVNSGTDNRLYKASFGGYKLIG